MKEPKPIIILVGLTILLIFILYFVLSILQPTPLEQQYPRYKNDINKTPKNNECKIEEPHYHNGELYYKDTLNNHQPRGRTLDTYKDKYNR